MRKILVITATLGNRKSLEKTISSVKNIGRNQVKHVIVAPEDTIPLLKNQYSNVEFLSEPKGGKGIYAALNYGFKKYGKEYKYLTFLNDDDYWLSDFKLLIDHAEKNDYDFIYGKINYVFSNDANRIKKMTCSGQFKDFIPLLYSHIVLFTQQATLLKSDLFFQLGGFSENFKLVSDTKFWADLSLLNIRYKYVPQVCAVYTIQDGQLSSNKQIQEKETIEMISQLPKPSIFKIYYAAIKFRFINFPIYLNRLKQHFRA